MSIMAVEVKWRSSSTERLRIIMMCEERRGVEGGMGSGANFIHCSKAQRYESAARQTQ